MNRKRKNTFCHESRWYLLVSMQHYKPQIPPCAFSTTWMGIAAGENSGANKPMLPRKAPAQEAGKSSRAYSPRVRREPPAPNRAGGMRKCKACSTPRAE